VSRSIQEDPSILTTSLDGLIAQINNNKATAFFIQDPFEMYVEVQPGRKSKHKLPVQLSKRPESHLESFHGTMAHFANNGMRHKLATVLTLRGATEYNERQDKKWERISNDDVPRCDGFIPTHLRDKPKFYNHALLGYLNKMAAARGITEPFPYCNKLSQNNGEKFLSDYFFEQESRKKDNMLESGQCICHECKAQKQNEKPAAARQPPPQVSNNPPAVATAKRRAPEPAAAATTEKKPRRRLLQPAGTTATSQQIQPTMTQWMWSPPRYQPMYPPMCLPTAMQMYQQPWNATALRLPQRKTTSNEGFCCRKYRAYLEFRHTHGKSKPGPAPHDSWCHVRK